MQGPVPVRRRAGGTPHRQHVVRPTARRELLFAGIYPYFRCETSISSYVGAAVQHAHMQRFYRPIFRGVYLPKSAEPTLRDRTVAAWLALGRRGVVAGLAASSLHGASWVDPDVPIELVSVKCRRQEGLIARHERIGADEVTRMRVYR